MSSLANALSAFSAGMTGPLKTQQSSLSTLSGLLSSSLKQEQDASAPPPRKSLGAGAPVELESHAQSVAAMFSSAGGRMRSLKPAGKSHKKKERPEEEPGGGRKQPAAPKQPRGREVDADEEHRKDELLPAEERALKRARLARDFGAGADVEVRGTGGPRGPMRGIVTSVEEVGGRLLAAIEFDTGEESETMDVVKLRLVG
ncbi:hypothetical protein TeGR_g9427 [Tetraparma gracilis]|uniref:Uncharacterized protein n=1 Tax=Tetraparma gracilis TaxID=2962635 RepID=A0ABQ6MCR8_9STRA|nr:hypothetical protein TeGR_g9427 [Tetraparma gracilis]